MFDPKKNINSKLMLKCVSLYHPHRFRFRLPEIKKDKKKRFGWKKQHFHCKKKHITSGALFKSEFAYHFPSSKSNQFPSNKYIQLPAPMLPAQMIRQLTHINLCEAYPTSRAPIHWCIIVVALIGTYRNLLTHMSAAWRQNIINYANWADAWSDWIYCWKLTKMTKILTMEIIN